LATALDIKKPCIGGMLKNSSATSFFILVPFPIEIDLLRKSAFSVGDELITLSKISRPPAP
jgi:hypothetical protein